MASIHVRSVLNLIDSFSKLFFLSSFKSVFEVKILPMWKSFSFWNVWTLTGFVAYATFHLTYVTQNDPAVPRTKMVTLFIDLYNKYSGLLLNGTLILTGYFQQTNIARIHLLLEEIEDVFLKQMKIKINNLNTLR